MTQRTLKPDLQIIFNEDAKSSRPKDIDSIAKKLEKIENLKSQVANKQKELDKIKKLYNKHALKEEQAFLSIKENYIIKLSERYFEKGYTKWQQGLLYDLIQSEASLLEDMEYSSEILTENLAKVDQHYLAQASELEKEMGGQMLKGFMENMGFNVDHNFSFDDFKNPDFIKQFTEESHEQRFDEQQKYTEKERHSKVLNTDVDFQKLYKKLIKLVHPDLFKTEEEKQQKEILVKRLTQAWEKRDYLELLLLKETIDVEHSIPVEFSGKNIKSITDQLNKKINELETEKYMISSHLGPNHFFFKNFKGKSENAILKKIDIYIMELAQNSKETEHIINNRLKNKTSTKRYLQEVFDEDESNDFDIFDFI
ncbi:hypothetical protein ACUN24_11170 [Pedobacter sp. WC2501]|uniref:hypothetical protein n=1 Tax=Pedobacter sp. WC2501 TaxID=3461400 RepID=UPI0040460A10